MEFRTATHDVLSHDGHAARLRLAIIGALVLTLSGMSPGTAWAAPADITVPLSPARPMIGVGVNPAAGVRAGRDVEVGYGGSVTVQFPALAAPGPKTVFGLFFNEESGGTPSMPPGYRKWNFSTDASQPDVSPLTVADLGGNAYRVDIPTVSDAGMPRPFWAVLQADGLTTTLPGGTDAWPGGHFVANLEVTPGGPTTASIATSQDVVSYLPTVSAASGGIIRLFLPASSSLRTAGMTSLKGTQISLHKANAGNLTEDWGPAEPVTTTVSADGQRATMLIPASIRQGLYALDVRMNHRPGPYVEASFLVNLSAPDPAPMTTASATPSSATPPATAVTSAEPAPDGVAAAPAVQPDLRTASTGHAWLAWTGLGVAVVAAAGGVGFLLRRKVSRR